MIEMKSVAQNGMVQEDVKIKWPNDLHAFDGTKYQKIGGLLVNVVAEGSKLIVTLGKEPIFHFFP